MATSAMKVLTAPFSGVVEKVKQEFLTEGFGIIRVNAGDPEKHNVGFEVRPFGMFYPCIVRIMEQDDGATEVSVSTPEFVTGTATSTAVQNFAVEVKRIVQTVLDAL